MVSRIPPDALFFMPEIRWSLPLGRFEAQAAEQGSRFEAPDQAARPRPSQARPARPPAPACRGRLAGSGGSAVARRVGEQPCRKSAGAEPFHDLLHMGGIPR